MQIGKLITLIALTEAPMGLFLGDGEEEILLPKRYVPKEVTIGDKLEVFVYLDNDNRPIATTLKPFAQVGDFAFLKVKELNQFGAFLDWGIDKDLFIPYSEQIEDLIPGDKYVVYIFIDERSGRIAASTKWNQFVDENTNDLTDGMEVKLIIAHQTELGYKAIVNNRYEGLLYKNEIFESLKVGNVKQGYIKQIREDGKIDLSLQQQGYGHITDTKHQLLQYLETHKGLIPLGDKSSPEEIYHQLKMSKKAFKKTVGGLFKDKLITITDFEIRLVQEE